MFAGDNALRMMGTERMAANGCQMPLVNTTDVHLQSLNTARFSLKGVSECLAFQLLRAFVAESGLILQGLGCLFGEFLVEAGIVSKYETVK